MPSPSSLRIRRANGHALAPSREYVLYWMIAARRPAWNYALDRALALCVELQRPLVVLEALRVDYPWASRRLHAFVLEGMRDNARGFRRRGVTYYPYVEPEPNAGRGLLAALASRACAVVTDEFPCSFLPRMVDAGAKTIDVQLEAVDGNGLVPLRAAHKAYPSAAHFRRVVQRLLREQLRDAPNERPFASVRLPASADVSTIQQRWPAAREAILGAAMLDGLPIDRAVARVETGGGFNAGRAALERFIRRRLDRYHHDHNHPDLDATSRLSPYLHFGHLSSHEVFAAVMRHERWTIGKLTRPATGAREGWWQVGPGAETFLDQLVTWRELAYNTCAHRPDYDQYESLPPWARATLEEHAADPRSPAYDHRALEQAGTHDPLWNAAQRQLLREGWMHGYLRMLWGKKILEWSPSPAAALEIMTAIMNRWSLDGRNPNSYAGYAWTLGRYDRPWPERPIFGKVRAMTSASAMRKLRVRDYLERYGEHS